MCTRAVLRRMTLCRNVMPITTKLNPTPQNVPMRNPFITFLMPIVHLSLIRPDLVEFDYLNSQSRPYYLVLRSLRTISMAFGCMVKRSCNSWTKKNRGKSKGSAHLRKLVAYSFLIALCGAILSWQTENFDNSYLFIDSFSVHHLSGYDKHHAFTVMENHFMNSEKSGLHQWSDHPFTLGFNINLVPRAFPLKVGGAGKGPGIGWSRVHLTPWNPGCNKLARFAYSKVAKSRWRRNCLC